MVVVFFPIYTALHVILSQVIKVLTALVLRLRSQKHKTIEARRDFWRVTWLNLLLKKSHLELRAQDHVQMAFE